MWYNRYSKVDLKNVELNFSDDKYYLSLTYLCEDERGIYEMRYPKIYLPIPKDAVPHIEQSFDNGVVPIPVVDLGWKKLILHLNEEGCYAEENMIKPKIHELSISEIEKKLGYKIKIVGEKDN